MIIVFIISVDFQKKTEISKFIKKALPSSWNTILDKMQ